jgi:rod shape-determining protein MreD
VNAGPGRAAWIILCSLLIAYALTVVPLPDWATGARPQWVALVLIYWCLAVPHRVGVGVAWLAGLAQDALQSTLLGQHAFSYAIAAFLVLKLHQRIRVYPLGQQSIIVLILLTMIHLAQLWVNGLVGRPPPPAAYWLAPLVGTLMWPWIFIIMRAVRRRYAIA